MNELVIIERTLAAAHDTHLTRELAALTERVNRLEAQIKLLARVVEGKARTIRQSAGRTRPVVLHAD